METNLSRELRMLAEQQQPFALRAMADQFDAATTDYLQGRIGAQNFLDIWHKAGVMHKQAIARRYRGL